MFLCFTFCARCGTGQRGRRGSFIGRHGPRGSFSTWHVWWLCQVNNKSLFNEVNRYFFIYFKYSLVYFFLFPAVFLPCSGSVMLTKGHTVLQRDSTDSSVLFIPLWWLDFPPLNHKHLHVLLNNTLVSYFCLSVKRLTCSFSALSRELGTGDRPGLIKTHFKE